MKASSVLFLLLAATAFGYAQTPLILSPPVNSPTVVSPLTNPTSQANQALLSQINSTISQRYFEHQVLTLIPPAAPTVFTTTTPTFRAR